MKDTVRIVLVTAPGGEGALRLARELVDTRAAACVNVIPGVRSVYRWEGAVEESDEDLLIIKVPASGVEGVKERVLALHPYDLPELLVLEVGDGLPAYLDWVASSVTGGA